MKPVVPVGKKFFLYLLGLLSFLKAVGLVCLAEAIALTIVDVIAGGTDWFAYFPLALLGIVLRSVTVWALQVVARRTALGVKEKLRLDVAKQVLDNADVSGGATFGTPGVGSVSVLLARGLDSLDNYYVQYLPAVISCVTVPLVLGLRIFLADWVSALVLVFTLPLIPVFMILIGQYTQDKINVATKSLEKLAHYLVELVKGLPVLVGLSKAASQRRTIVELDDKYRIKTMGTLRVAFLSSLALEIIATISVAVVAVFIGLRLVSGNMDLHLALVVLLIVPECYLPFRDLGSAYHASVDGLEVLKRVQNILLQSQKVPYFSEVGVQKFQDIQIEGLSVKYGQRNDFVFEDLSLTIVAKQTTLLVGASGCGKSTLLNLLAGLVTGEGENVVVGGKVWGVASQYVSWVGQHPVAVEDVVLDELLLYGADEAFAYECLEKLFVEHLAHKKFSQLSPGEFRRVALARALVTIDKGASVLLLDEPTAHLDSKSCEIISQVVAKLQGTITIVLVTHDKGLFSFADAVVSLSAGGDSGVKQSVDVLLEDGVVGGERFFVNSLGEEFGVDKVAQSGGGFLRVLWQIVGGERKKFFWSVFLGVLSASFGIFLTGVSGWLIIRASQQPPVLYLLVAIVSVRFFGLGKAVLKYFEKLFLHEAIFLSLSSLRIRVWDSLSKRGLAARYLLQGKSTVSHLIGDVDMLKDFIPRVFLPPLVALGVWVFSVVVVWVFLPLVLWWQVLGGVLIFLLVPVVALWANRKATVAEAVIKSKILERLLVLCAAAADLRVNNVHREVLGTVAQQDGLLTKNAQRTFWAQGLAQGLVVLVCLGQALVVLVVGGQQVFLGSLSSEVWVACVFLQLALVEPFTQIVGSVIHFPVVKFVLQRFVVDLEVGDDGVGSEVVADGVVLGTSVDSLRLERVFVRWSDMERFVFADFSLELEGKSWVTVMGASGSGKSTLLAVLLGFLSPESGKYLLDGVDCGSVLGGQKLRKIAWCPQDAYLFDSTLRSNLLLACDVDDLPDDEVLVGVLGLVGLRDWFLGLVLGLDTKVGSNGAMLSGGQRRRVAVARVLLSDADVVLLDEPTAHLDFAGGRQLLDDLRVALSEKIVVLVTHNESDVQLGDKQVVLV